MKFTQEQIGNEICAALDKSRGLAPDRLRQEAQLEGYDMMRALEFLEAAGKITFVNGVWKCLKK